MRVLVAGATGAVGQSLIPALVARGHTVGGLARNPDGVATLGGLAIAADVLDRDAVIHVVEDFAPTVVIHQLTALPRASTMWRFEKDFEQTNRLRTEGTDHLIEAARAAGARRFIAQSFCGWPYARTGPAIKTEADELDPNPPVRLRTTLDAIRYHEGVVLAAVDLKGTVLRYGGFYGPNTHLALGSAMADQVRTRKFPVIGGGAGVWSFSHIVDVAEATTIAAESDVPGIFNVVDDDPAPVAIWLPYLAQVIGAPPPRRIPLWLARLILPEHLRVMMTEIRGASNALFRRTFNWTPRYPSWREGFATEFRL